MVYQDSLTVTVNGIVKQLEGNSDFIFTDIISMGMVRASWLKNNYSFNLMGTSSHSQAWIIMPERVHDLDNAQFLKAANSYVAKLEKEESYFKHFH